MLTLKRDQKREMDAVYRKFANHRDDLEKLSQTQTQLQVRARVRSYCTICWHTCAATKARCSLWATHMST